MIIEDKRRKEDISNIYSAEVCERTRRTAGDAFLIAIKRLWGSSFSEQNLKDLWLTELRKHRHVILPSGWYTPPPDGIGILIGDTSNPTRLNYDSLRLDRNWPQNNIIFDPKTGLAYVYASPVDKSTGIIGDFGMTLYAGNNPEIIAHLQKVYAINHAIDGVMKPGIKVSDAYQQVCGIFEKEGLTNNVTSVTDPRGINIGHSVPGVLPPYTQGELNAIQGDNWERVCKVISQKRIFFNGNEDYVLKTGDCFTLEPRLTDLQKPYLPMASYHTNVKITKASAELFENFDEIFHAINMDYML